MIIKENLAEIIKSQKEWLLNTERGIKRDKLESIKLSESFALVITGIRRCGKSTLLNQLASKEKNFYYLNLEDPRLTGFDLEDFNKVDEINKQLYGNNSAYFFDEIQNVGQWERFIRFLVDKKSKVVITGSNASLLSKELGTKLTGRKIQAELFPFSFSEFLRFFNLKANNDSYERYLINGGFPEFLKEHNEAILQELLNDIIIKDVSVKFGIKNNSILKKMAIYLISNVGKEFSYNSLKRMFEVKSVQSVIDYISYIEDTYLIFTVPMFSYSYKKQQISPKKVYSIDNGLSRVNSVSFSQDKGKMLENSVFLALKQQYKEIFYFQKNKECDFIIKDRNKIQTAIQVCYDLNRENKERELEGLLDAMKEFSLREGLILTYNQEDELNIKDRKIKIIPVWKWLMR